MGDVEKHNTWLWDHEWVVSVVLCTRYNITGVLCYVQVFNPLNPKIKIWILICYPYLFPTEVVGRSW